MYIKAESLAAHCRAESQMYAEKAERLAAGAKLLAGVHNAESVHKMQEALYSSGQADAFGAVADAVERLIREGAPDPGESEQLPAASAGS